MASVLPPWWAEALQDGAELRKKREGFKVWLTERYLPIDAWVRENTKRENARSGVSANLLERQALRQKVASRARHPLAPGKEA
jgi:hypothetical protein